MRNEDLTGVHEASLSGTTVTVVFFRKALTRPPSDVVPHPR